MTKILPDIPQASDFSKKGSDVSSRKLFNSFDYSNSFAVSFVPSIFLVLSSFTACVILSYWFWGEIAAVFLGFASALPALIILIKWGKPFDLEGKNISSLSLLEGSLAHLPFPVLVTSTSGKILLYNHQADYLIKGKGLYLKSLVSFSVWRKMKSWLDSRSVEGLTLTADLSYTGRHFEIYANSAAGLCIWTFYELKDNAGLAAEALKDVKWLEPILSALNLGLVITDSEDRLTFSSGNIVDWIEKAGAHYSIDRLSLNNSLTKLKYDGGISFAVTPLVFPFGEQGEQNAGQLLILRRSESYIYPDHGEGEEEWQGGPDRLDPRMDAAPIAIALIDENGRIKEYNKPLISFMGGDIVVGQDIKQIADPEERPMLDEAIKFVHTTGAERQPVDINFAQTSDRLGQVSFSRVSKNDSCYVMVFVIDRTQEKSLERQFVQAQKMQAIGQLAGGVAHDFNNLLTAILGFSDLLLMRHNASDQSFSDIMQIKQNANRAANLVRQLLAFSRQQTMRPRTLWVTEVLSEITNLLRRLIGEKIELRIKHGRNLMPVRVDPSQLDQVIINLAVNARDAMDGVGFLDIETSMVIEGSPLFDHYSVVEVKDYILLKISDTGMGIPAEIQSKIFEPFFTTKEVGQGTGLGLATVYGIIKQIGGYIFVSSTVGQGTDFLLFLPATKIDDESVDTQKEQPDIGKDLSGKGDILLVEDEDPVRLLTKRALSARGYNVHEAANGEAALMLLKENPELSPVLLISDVVMPNMDGPALLKGLRKRWKALPVIFISGYAEDVVRKSLEEESVHFLQKPFSLKDISSLVKSIIR